MNSTLTLIFISFLFVNHILAQEDFMDDRQDTTTIKTSLGKLEIIGFNYSLDNKSHVKISTRGYCDLGLYGEGVFQEAEAQNVVKDVVYVEFVQDSSCQFVDVRILKTGKLENFNLYVKDWCNVFIEKLDEINDSILVGKDNEYYQCESLRLPLTLVIL